MYSEADRQQCDSHCCFQESNRESRRLHPPPGLGLFSGDELLGGGGSWGRARGARSAKKRDVVYPHKSMLLFTHPISPSVFSSTSVFHAPPPAATPFVYFNLPMFISNCIPTPELLILFVLPSLSCNVAVRMPRYLGATISD